jgi:hypothetical protein
MKPSEDTLTRRRANLIKWVVGVLLVFAVLLIRPDPRETLGDRQLMGVLVTTFAGMMCLTDPWGRPILTILGLLFLILTGFLIALSLIY